MAAPRVLLSRFLDLLFRRRREARLSQEIREHLELLADEYIAAGMTPGEARQAARRAFGGIEQVKETYRDQRGLPFVDALGQDVRFAARLLRRNPGFAATAVLVLGVGIGVNNMLFTILYAHTLRGLPVDRVDRVMFLSTFDDRTPDRGVSYLDFVDWQGAVKSGDLAAFRNAPVVISERERTADRLDGTYVSESAFSLIGIRPILGRTFTPQDHARGAAGVVMLGAGTWESRYGRDSAVLGRSVLVNGAPATIVGIMSDRSGFPSTAQIWIPLSQMSGLFSQARDARTLSVLGRLRDGATIEGVRAEIDGIADRLSRDHIDTNRNVRARVTPINERYLGRLTDPAWRAFMTVGFVIVLISCANVANLLLGRSVTRRREIAMRTSLGASRARVIRQLLIEGTVLAAFGAAAGLAIALAGVRLFSSAIPENVLPYWLDYTVDARVISALVSIAIMTVFVFALLPAVQATKVDINVVLKDAGGAGLGRRGRRWTTAFLAAEFALAVILLAHLSVNIRSSSPSLPSDDLIDGEEVVTAVLTLPGERYKTPEQRQLLYQQLRERIIGAAPVAASALANYLPVTGAEEQVVDVEGQRQPDPDARRSAWAVAVSPGYFATFGLTLERGRDFAGEDGLPGQASVIVNHRFAELFFGDRDPLGQRIALSPKSDAAAATATSWTIVGVSPSIRQRPVSEVEPVVYLPFRSTATGNATLLVRSAGDTGTVISFLRNELARLDPNLPLYRVRTMAQVIRDTRWNGRLSSALFLALTCIAVSLATVGLYAVASYGVSQETREIGLRMAFGAQPRQVVLLVIKRVAVQLAAGFGAGIICTKLWVSMFRTGRPDISAADPESLLIVALVLTVLAAIACYLPVRRATRLDPVAAIREN
jgi:putative ABC transport system permease protein